MHLMYSTASLRPLHWAERWMNHNVIPSESEIVDKIYKDYDLQRDMVIFRYNDGNVEAHEVVPIEMLTPTNVGVIRSNFVKSVQDKYRNSISEGCDMGTGNSYTCYLALAPQTNMPKIVSVDIYNNKVVKVTFDDGTFEKAVCDSGDTFNVDVGITICLLKKMLGKDGHKKYNKLMRETHRLMIKNVVDKAVERQNKAEARRKAQAAAEKKARKRACTKQDVVDAIREALGTKEGD